MQRPNKAAIITKDNNETEDDNTSNASTASATATKLSEDKNIGKLDHRKSNRKPITLENVNVIVGKRGSGKTRLCMYFLSKLKQEYQTIWLISPTEKLRPYFEPWIDRKNVIDEWDDDWVSQFYERMQKLNSNKPKEQHHRVLLVLDDCFVQNSKRVRDSSILDELILRGRHSSIDIVFLVQYYSLLNPIARSNSSYVYVGQTNTASVSALYKEYGCSVSNSEFKQLYEENTSDRYFLRINCESVNDCRDIGQIYTRIRVPKDFVDQYEHI